MKIKIGVMGSAGENLPADLGEQAAALGHSIAARGAILLTGATTGLVTPPERRRMMRARCISVFRPLKTNMSMSNAMVCQPTRATQSSIPALA